MTAILSYAEQNEEGCFSAVPDIPPVITPPGPIRENPRKKRKNRKIKKSALGRSFDPAIHPVRDLFRTETVDTKNSALF